jgi:lipopolysaccharide transport system permease protein
MVRYLSAVWKCRFFWMSLVRMDLRTRYRRSILGMGWSLLHPVAMTAILCAVFHNVFKVNVQEYAPFLLAGLATWNFLTTVTLTGCQCFFQGESYIRQHPAPLAIYPLRTAMGGMIHFLLALSVVLVLAGYLNGFKNVLCLFSLVPTVALLFVLGWSLALLAGYANVHFQDTQHLCEVGFQMLFYMTPIIYKEEVLRATDLGWIMDYNPLVPFFRLIRQPILEGKVPDMSVFGTALLTVTAVAAAASFVQSRLQRGLIFHL